MRLLRQKRSGDFEISEDRHDNISPYAILSHRWGREEVSFDDVKNGTGKRKAGYRKLQFIAAQAANHGLDHFWVDTCCIDKSSSAELSEAINSMYTWYQRSTRCYVYLWDVPEVPFRDSNWFTRGWTLQELLAPASVEFFNSEFQRLGNKGSLEIEIGQVTGIPINALQGQNLSDFSIPERMSWARERSTTRREDEAYCLLGIFGIYIPPIYGEGSYAFTRLKAAIEQQPTGPMVSTSQPREYFSRDDAVEGEHLYERGQEGRIDSRGISDGLSLNEESTGPLGVERRSPARLRFHQTLSASQAPFTYGPGHGMDNTEEAWRSDQDANSSPTETNVGKDTKTAVSAASQPRITSGNPSPKSQTRKLEKQFEERLEFQTNLLKEKYCRHVSFLKAQAEYYELQNHAQHVQALHAERAATGLRQRISEYDAQMRDLALQLQTSQAEAEKGQKQVQTAHALANHLESCNHHLEQKLRGCTQHIDVLKQTLTTAQGDQLRSVKVVQCAPKTEGDFKRELERIMTMTSQWAENFSKMPVVELLDNNCFSQLEKQLARRNCVGSVRKLHSHLAESFRMQKVEKASARILAAAASFEILSIIVCDPFFAFVGAEPQAGVYGREAVSGTPQVLQLIGSLKGLTDDFVGDFAGILISRDVAKTASTELETVVYTAAELSRSLWTSKWKIGIFGLQDHLESFNQSEETILYQNRCGLEAHPVHSHWLKNHPQMLDDCEVIMVCSPQVIAFGTADGGSHWEERIWRNAVVWAG